MKVDKAYSSRKGKENLLHMSKSRDEKQFITLTVLKTGEEETAE